MPRREEDYGELLHPGGLATIIASPAAMHTWSGSIISVPTAYTGIITRILIRMGATDYTVPATIQLNSSVELVAYGKLDSASLAVKTGMRATVTAPGKTPVTWVKEMITKQNPGQELRFDIKSFIADTVGTWTAIIEYYAIP